MFRVRWTCQNFTQDENKRGRNAGKEEEKSENSNEGMVVRIRELEKALQEKDNQLTQSKKISLLSEERAQKIRQLEMKLQRAERTHSQRRVSMGEDSSFKVRELEERLEKSKKEIEEMVENHSVKIKELQILLREKEEDLGRTERQYERKIKERDEEIKKDWQRKQEAWEGEVGAVETCQGFG